MMKKQEATLNYIKLLEKEMTPQQIEKGQEMARNWKPNK
jgi:hypothetical protein